MGFESAELVFIVELHSVSTYCNNFPNFFINHIVPSLIFTRYFFFFQLTWNLINMLLLSLEYYCTYNS